MADQYVFETPEEWDEFDRLQEMRDPAEVLGEMVGKVLTPVGGLYRCIVGLIPHGNRKTNDDDPVTLSTETDGRKSTYLYRTLATIIRPEAEAIFRAHPEYVLPQYNTEEIVAELSGVWHRAMEEGLAPDIEHLYHSTFGGGPTGFILTLAALKYAMMMDSDDLRLAVNSFPEACKAYLALVTESKT